jgi:hypothetical protein
MGTPRGQGDAHIGAVLLSLLADYGDESGAGGIRSDTSGIGGRARYVLLKSQFQFDAKNTDGQQNPADVIYRGQYDTFAEFFRTLAPDVQEAGVYAALEKYGEGKMSANGNAAQIAELEEQLAQANAEKQVLYDSKGGLERLLKMSQTSQNFCNQEQLASLNMLAAPKSPVGPLSNENVDEWIMTTQRNLRCEMEIIDKWSSANDEVTKRAEETLKAAKVFATEVSAPTYAVYLSCNHAPSRRPVCVESVRVACARCRSRSCAYAQK